MIRANLFDFIELGQSIREFNQFVDNIKDNRAPGIDVFLQLVMLRQKFQKLQEGAEYLSVTRHPLQKVISSLDTAIGDCQEEVEEDGEKRMQFRRSMPTYSLGTIVSNISNFEHVFSAECLDTPSYVVEKTGIFNTKDLVENSILQIPSDFLVYLPDEAKNDYKNSGRCLALKLHNASAFHALRSVEAVLHKYLAYYTDEKTAQRCKSWANYVNKLKLAKDNSEKNAHPSEKVIRNIDQMRDLDRNPIMHPRDNLDENQAFLLFQNATTAIISMLEEIHESTVETK